jgi:hypothetical protein
MSVPTELLLVQGWDRSYRLNELADLSAADSAEAEFEIHA